MSFKQISAFQPATYITAIAELPETDPITADATDSGTLDIAMHDSAGHGDAAWLTGREQILSLATVSSASIPGANIGVMRIDPEFQLLDAPGSVHYVLPGIGDDMDSFIVGQFNPDTGDQLVLASSTPAPLSTLRRLNITTLVLDLGNHFTGGPNGDFWASKGSAVSSAVEGYWVTTVTPGAMGQFFDGLVDGIPGETVATGTNIYPQGLYLVNTDVSRVDGTLYGTGWTWVDIWTRDAVGRLGGLTPTAFPAEATTATSSTQQLEAPIGNDVFLWACRQYVPDGDATFARPKGRLVFQSSRHLPGAVSAGNANEQRVYLRLTDFNPFGVAAAAGQSERVHGRIRVTSRWNLNHDPHFALAGQESLTTDSTTLYGFIFDPMRNRFVTSLRDNTVAGSPADPYGVVTGTTVGFLSLQIELDSITAPVSLDVPRTGTVVEYITLLEGDLAEPISGQSVDWTLERLSTEGEVLDATTFPGTSTVANGPIDTNPDGTSIMQLFSDGSLLTLTTDYTVVASTGVITWVTDQSGAALVTATYEHRATPASPAHGTLISSSSTTDTAGIARTTVFYADDDLLVGTLDIIGVVAS